MKTIDLNDYLPEGVSLAGMDSSEITVTLTVEQLKELPSMNEKSARDVYNFFH